MRHWSSIDCRVCGPCRGGDEAEAEAEGAAVEVEDDEGFAAAAAMGFESDDDGANNDATALPPTPLLPPFAATSMISCGGVSNSSESR